MCDDVVFSVIMPCYNSESYVADAIESLLKQNYSKWELVAVNDGSTDNTLRILKEFADRDKRIKVYSKKNGGYSTAINFGLDKITGDYFLMLGSDDSLEQELFYDIYSNIQSVRPDVIAFRAVTYRDKKKLGVDRVTDFESTVQLFDSNLKEFSTLYPKHSRIMYERDTAKCYKTSLLGNLRYFGKFGYDADGVFSTIFVRKCKSFVCLPIDGYRWTKRDDSVSANVSIEKNIDRVKVWGQYIDALKAESISEFTEIEKKYVVMPFRVGCQLLKVRKQLCFFDILRIHDAMRKAITFSKEHNISLMEFDEIFVPNGIKRTIFQQFPIFFLLRYGFVTNN